MSVQKAARHPIFDNSNFFMFLNVLEASGSNGSKKRKSFCSFYIHFLHLGLFNALQFSQKTRLKLSLVDKKSVQNDFRYMYSVTLCNIDNKMFLITVVRDDRAPGQSNLRSLRTL